MIENDKLIRKTPIYDGRDLIGISKDLIITKEEFLACYNVWVLGENYRPNCDGDMRGKKENEST